MSPDGVVQAAAVSAALDRSVDPALARDARDISHPIQRGASLGLLEVLLPLWHRRWWLLLSMLLCAALATGIAFTRTVRFTATASFVSQPQLRPSQAVVASALPSLAGLMGGGGSPADLHVALLRSEAINDRIIERFRLQQMWDIKLLTQARMKLARRIGFGVGRRDGVVQVIVEDENPQRAASMANEYIEELRNTLRAFALEEARQRRQFYDTQLAQARGKLETAQKQLQGTGFDRAALRTEPRASAEAYVRLQAELAAAEVRLASTRRTRTEESAEVQQHLADLSGLRAQLSKIETPRAGGEGEGPGSFVARVREFRYAESLVESIARQAEAARVDEASDQIPLQVVDRAKPPELPSSPVPMRWLIMGALLGLLLPAAWILTRHNMAVKRLDPAYQERLATIRAVMARRQAPPP
jgi:uncharacterized protein involved in exopolysaccharide biosynthesis